MNNHAIPELDHKGLREFGLVTGAIIAALFGLLFPWLFDVAIPRWPFVAGGALALWGLVHPPSLGPVYRTWMKFGLLLSRFTTPVIMGVVFFLVVFPMGLLMRIAGKDPMARKFDANTSSYRVDSSNTSQQSLERPF